MSQHISQFKRAIEILTNDFKMHPIEWPGRTTIILPDNEWDKLVNQLAEFADHLQTAIKMLKTNKIPPDAETGLPCVIFRGWCVVKQSGYDSVKDKWAK